MKSAKASVPAIQKATRRISLLLVWRFRAICLAIGGAYSRAPRLQNVAIEPDARKRSHQWREEAYYAQPERGALFETISGQPIEPLYTEEDLAGWDTERDLGFPGEFPYTRG